MKLKLNPDKTEFIVIGHNSRESLIPIYPVTFLQSSMSPAGKVKNLGVSVDSEDTFDSYLDKICLACHYHLRYLQFICKFLTVDTAALLINAMVNSKLDFCISLLYRVGKGSVAKHQKVQNMLVTLPSDWTKRVMPKHT